MECNLLPICGGPCFQRKYQSVAGNMDFCIKDRVDTDMETFVKKYYAYVQKMKKVKCDSVEKVI